MPRSESKRWAPGSWVYQGLRGQKALNKAWAEGDIKAKWDASSWAKKLAAQKTRASTNDFGRFRAMLLKKKKSKMIKKKLAEMRK